MVTLAEKLIMVSKTKVVSGAVEFVSSTPMTITPQYTNSGVTLQYSLDGTSWTTIASGATTPGANIIYFRGSAAGTNSLYASITSSNAWTFSGATNLRCNGKLDRLIQNNLGGDDDILTIGDYCFAYIFNNVTSLIRVDDDFLPATTLARSCYQNMFQGCTGLTIAPALPTTTLAINCYAGMFQGCIGLTIAPALPATTLAISCYINMFLGCKGLTTAPELPATTLASSCYYGMLYGCTGLTIAPELPATTLAISCYDRMFLGCKGLTTAPELPATTLASSCYYGMLYGCTGLTTLPKLSTLALQPSCYYRMFYGCTKIKVSTALTGIYDTAYRIPITGEGTTATSALEDMFTGTGGTFTGTPTINTTYYTENTPV